MRFGDNELAGLVRNLVAPSMWAAYGKAWWEGLACAGSLQVECGPSKQLRAMLDYLLCLRRLGVSGMVTQHRIAGMSFHFQFWGWENIGQQFLVHRTLQGKLK